VVHPRAAGFTVLIFSSASSPCWSCSGRERGEERGRERRAWWAPLAILALFALWANLHGGFVAASCSWGWRPSGLRSIAGEGYPAPCHFTYRRAGLIAIPGGGNRHHCDPLGGAIWSYRAQLPEPGDLAGEHGGESAFSSPWPVVYLSSGDRLRGLGCGCGHRSRAAPPPAGDAGFLVSRVTRYATSSSSARCGPAGRVDRAESIPDVR